MDHATKLEKDDIKKLATEVWENGVIEDISALLESLPRDLLLVLRTKYENEIFIYYYNYFIIIIIVLIWNYFFSDLIMGINKDLGFPVNRFVVMARASIRGIVVTEGK